LDTLSTLPPARYNATPAIKAQPTALLGAEWPAGPMSLYDPNSANSYFTYGGYWLATPLSPPGLQYNSLYGRSSNQEMLNGSTSVPLEPNDYVFLRPDQSEAVFLQFGDIAVFVGKSITALWTSFPVSARLSIQPVLV